MIIANHLGEHLIPTLVAGGAAAAPALLIMLRAKLNRVGSALRRSGGGHVKRVRGA